MMRAPGSCPRLLSGHRFRVLAGLVLIALALAGCAGQTPTSLPGKSDAYVVFFTATRSSDHAAIPAASVPVTLGGKATVKIRTLPPAENRPVLTTFVVRLNRRSPSGVYELVTRVTVREDLRNKKGKLKVDQRNIGALVPTRLGETQVVSTESDPIHLEARLERR